MTTLIIYHGNIYKINLKKYDELKIPKACPLDYF
jgi:hypothetical protein